MKLKHLTVAGAIALAASGATANDIEYYAPVFEGETYFAVVHTDAYDFTDVFTFDIEGPVRVSAMVSTEGAGLQNIDFVSADLNGEALTLSPTDFAESGAIDSVDLVGPLILTVTGKSGSFAGTFALYEGTLEITPIPEPTTVGPLAALGALAGLRRNRRRS